MICVSDCYVNCTWSEWFDVSYPKYEPNGGDYETYENIRNAGFDICEKPEAISCRQDRFPGIPLEELGQKVTCDVSTGLVCNNKDQAGSMPPVCYNYQIRVYCCVPELPEWCKSTPKPPTTTRTTTTTPPTTTTTTTPPTTTTTPPTTTSPPTTTATTTPPTTTTTTPTTTITTTESTTSTSSLSSTTVTPTTVPTSPTTDCYVNCTWSEWFDVSYPKYEPNGGDYETYEYIRNAGLDICEKPEAISCRQDRFPDIPLEELGQKVTCDVSTGLVCNNKDQAGSMPPVCY
ncbi:hypothetical protein AB205_0166450, partial [Aquarana catesbeiana]